MSVTTIKNVEELNVEGIMNEIKKCDNIIITHWGDFHADEVTASALLNTFVAEEFYTIRVPHQADVEEIKSKVLEADSSTKIFILDVGRKFDSENLYFDHHQFTASEMPVSSAGMIWNWLKEQGLINKIVEEELDNMIKAVDENDIGITPFKPGDYSWIIHNLNSDDSYDHKRQSIAFYKAQKLASDIFMRIKKDSEAALSAQAQMEKLESFKLNSEDEFDVLEIPDDMEDAKDLWWKVIFNIPKFDKVDAIIRHKPETGEWSAQTVALKDDRFTKRGRAIKAVDPLPDDIVFVHNAQFFMVAKTRDALIAYLKENFR